MSKLYYPMFLPPLIASLIFFNFAASSNSIHELLRQHGLPAGVIPKNINSFFLDPTTGLLEVRLDQPCYTKYDSPAFFDSVVRGNLSYGALRGVVGLKQEELFLWLPVRGIVVTDPFSGVILFDIGLAHKRLSMSLFEVPPECLPERITAGDRPVTEGLLDRKERLQDQK
ncbi:uncharacterized protein LOC110022827 [Phalaenopsis equestris]|uniref:uncharacterized protein LOC110022827 n=1 Tax=Phalaenopsis equestris TaxID=78828 RepID=UPI0009E23063|nr:uncharacterized protein LOC110022827 [Phalaenopsis equestris]